MKSTILWFPTNILLSSIKYGVEIGYSEVCQQLMVATLSSSFFGCVH
jgi:hypothetical protein